MNYAMVGNMALGGFEPPSPDAGLDAHFLATFFCTSCGSVAPCSHPPGPERQESLVGLLRAMARDLLRAGYAVTPPTAGELRTVRDAEPSPENWVTCLDA